MALATLTLTTNSKCIDFHRNAAEITGVESGDEYLYIDKLLRMSILDDGIILKFNDNSEIYMPTDQVETVGATTHLGGFPTTADLKTAMKTLLSL